MRAGKTEKRGKAQESVRVTSEFFFLPPATVNRTRSTIDARIKT